VVPNSYIYAFDKLDGSNIRAEWSKKRGFWKFGTKTRLVDSTDSIFGKAPDLILNKYGDELGRILHKNNWDRSICFFEFYGENSAFGIHKDEEHAVTLLDINVYKKGILSPKEFINLITQALNSATAATGQTASNIIYIRRGAGIQALFHELGHWLACVYNIQALHDRVFPSRKPLALAMG